MHMTTKILAIGFALGIALGGAAHATPGNPIACNKEWVGAKNKTCTDPDTGTKVTVDADADATAIAAALANATATGGSASATGGTATASNGDQSINISNPKVVRSYGIGITADVGDLMRVKTDNLAKIVTTVDGASDKCFAAKVMNESPALFNWRTGKRLTLSC